MKITKKRGKRGADRKALNTKVSPDAYLWLCQLAGNNSLAETLNDLLLESKQKKSELTLPTSHE
ncbi:MAG TPA: hypothetical protein DIT28_16560 [Oxalobacteraceae bacterium]|nr:hypothetical protein [Oxalobacteraceae bacterium]